MPKVKVIADASNSAEDIVQATIHSPPTSVKDAPQHFVLAPGEEMEFELTGTQYIDVRNIPAPAVIKPVVVDVPPEVPETKAS